MSRGDRKARSPRAHLRFGIASELSSGQEFGFCLLEFSLRDGTFGLEIMQARGQLDFVATVGPDGKATHVDSLGGVTGVNAREMSNYVASVLMMAKYKPAVCGGQPCTMQFPFKLKL